MCADRGCLRDVSQKTDVCSPSSVGAVAHESLAATVEQIEATAINIVKSAVARAAARVNLLGPVHRLSNDVLIDIFNRLDNKQLIHAARVCARWRAAALSTPSLWSKIDFNVDTGLKAHLHIMLARSHRVPIDLKLRMWGFGPSFDHDDPDEEAEAAAEAEAHMELLEVLLKRQSHRLRSLSVKYDHSTFDYNAELYLPGAPLLTDLELNWADAILPLDLIVPSIHTTNPFPVLKRLRLCGVLDVLDVLPRFANVTSLTLRFPHSYESTSLTVDLDAVIAVCPSIEDLALVGIGDAKDTTILCSSGIRLPARFQLLLDGSRAHEVANDLCTDFSSAAILPRLYVRDRYDKPTMVPVFRIFDHLQPLLPDACSTKLYIEHIPTRSGHHMHHACAVEQGGRARGIRATKLDLKLLGPLVGAYAFLTIDSTYLTSSSFPAALLNMKSLRVRVTEKILPVHVDHKVYAPALRNFELFFTRSRDDPAHPIIVRDVSNFLFCRFADLGLPLDSVKIFGTICSNGNQEAATRRLAAEFFHAPALE